MGVPKFYRWISERYPCLSEVVKEFQIPEFDNLYLDMNGIIHVCSHPEDDNPHFRITEEKIFEDIMHYLEFLFRMIKPRKVFFMAVDGVAPRAKMNQQRGRRFRSAREAEELEKRARDKGEVLPSEKRFDSNCITPGTPFMVRLQEQLKYFVVKKVSTDPLWRGVRVFLSGHETPGEGEHKIMDFIRQERSLPDYDHNTRHCLYGLDADLMMLGLATHDPHFSLLREEVRFGGRKNQSKRPATPEETTFHLLHLSLFREYLDFEFSALKATLPFPYDLESVIDDWVMMGFLVGNDFIPHLPNLHINHDALPLLWQTYIDVLPSCGGYINVQGHLNLERFEKYLTALSKFDIDTFSEQYGDLKWLEGKAAERQEQFTAEKKELLSAARKLRKNQMKSDNQFAALENFNNDDELEDFGEDLDSPEVATPEDITASEEDSEDTFEDEFRHHKRHYYMTKMDYEKVTPEVLQDQAEGYVRGIQWILLYYYEGVPSWSWFYPHHYAPYMSDVKNFSHLTLTFDLGEPFLPFEQLMAVLPAASRELLPKPFQNLMIMDNSPVIDFYPPEFQTDLNGKQQDWEAVVLIPFIDEERLLTAMRSVANLMTDEERQRNRHGPCLLYEYSPTPGPTYPSSIPGVFPDIAVNHSCLTEISIENMRLDPQLLKKGLLEEVRLDVFFPGFPTLKHIEHTSELKKEGVKVFQMNSRGYNVMLHITPQEEEPDLEQIAKEYLGKEVYVHWPHLYQALVVSVSDGSECYTRVEASKEKGKSGKSVAKKFEIRREEMDENDCNIWKKEISNIAETYRYRLGVVIGQTDILLKVLPMTGRKYVCGVHGRITTEKQFGTLPVPFALQATVKDITVHDPGICQFHTIQEYLPEKCPVFMLGWPHYGCQGDVIEVENTENGRVRINLTILEEPHIAQIMDSRRFHTERYYPGYAVAQKLGISSNFLSRITGTIYVTMGSPDSGSEQKINVGLNLKFTKRAEEVPGYTRLLEGQWLYSDKTTDTVREYMKRFPEVWTYICASDKKHNDMFYETEVFPKDCSYNLKSMQEYIKAQPCHSLKPVKAGSDIIGEGVISALEKEANRVVGLNKKKQKRVKLQVKPHLLYRPLPTHGALIPDPSTTYETFDRVVNVRQGFPVPFGLRGTVVGIHPAENETNTMYEVLFDEEFLGGISIRASSKRGYRMPPSGLLNITHGERKNGVSKPSQQQRQMQTNSPRHGQQQQDVSYAQASRGWYPNQNINNQYSRPDNRASYPANSRGGYSNTSGGGYSGGFDNRSGQQQYQNRQSSGGSHANREKRGSDSSNWRKDMDTREENWRKGPDSRGENKAGSGRSKDGSLAGQVFNGDSQTGSQSQPKFVTPKVSHGASGRRQSQGDKEKIVDNANTEFEDMWKQLKSSAPPVNNQTVQGTSLQQAAAALPTVTSLQPPSAGEHSSSGQTKIDVENLFSHASKVQTGDEFAAMFKSLENSGKQQKGDKSATADTAHPSQEDGTALIKKMLHLDVTDSEQKADTDTAPPSSAPPKSYGRQVSIQELFDGAKQQQGKEEEKPGAMSTKTVEESNEEQQHPVAKQHSPQQPSQPANQNQGQQTWQQQQLSSQAAPLPPHLLLLQQQAALQKRPNVLVPNPPGSRRNPVMELVQFTQTLNLPPPAYDYISRNGKVISIVTVFNVGRFQGVLCKNREEAAESAASVALLQMRGSMQQMAMHPVLRMPTGLIQGMMPQGHQFSSPNSAFSPVPNFTGNFQRGPYPGQQNPRGYNTGNFNRGPPQQQQRGSHRPQQHHNPTNQSGSRQQLTANQVEEGVSPAQISPNQVAANKNDSASSANHKRKEMKGTNEQGNVSQQGQKVQTSSQSNPGLTPFIPLQVARKQTPHKGRKESVPEETKPGEKESTSSDSVNKTTNSSIENQTVLSNSHEQVDSKQTMTQQTNHAPHTSAKGSNLDSYVTPSKSEEKRQTPGSDGKRKSRRRMAANLNFGKDG